MSKKKLIAIVSPPYSESPDRNMLAIVSPPYQDTISSKEMKLEELKKRANKFTLKYPNKRNIFQETYDSLIGKKL